MIIWRLFHWILKFQSEIRSWSGFPETASPIGDIFSSHTHHGKQVWPAVLDSSVTVTMPSMTESWWQLNHLVCPKQKQWEWQGSHHTNAVWLSDHHTNAVYLDGKVSEVKGLKKKLHAIDILCCFAFPPSNQSCTCGSVLFCQAGSKHLAKTTCYSCFKEVADVIEP